MLDVAVWAVPFGIVGGRLYHVITSPGPYFGAGGTRSTPSRSGRAGWASGAPSRSVPWARGSPAGGPGSAPAFADATRPASRGAGHRPARQLVQQRAVRRPDDLPWGLQVHQWDQSAGPGRLDAAGKPVAARPLPPDVPLRGRLPREPRRPGCSSSTSALARHRAAARPVRRRLHGRAVWIETMRTDRPTSSRLRLNVWTIIWCSSWASGSSGSPAGGGPAARGTDRWVKSKEIQVVG